MPTERKAIRDELSELVREGRQLHVSELLKTDESLKKQLQQELAAAAAKAKKSRSKSSEPVQKLSDFLRKTEFRTDYQRWYSKAVRVIEQLALTAVPCR